MLGKRLGVISVFAATLAGAAHAQSPQLGGPMEHLLVYQVGDDIVVDFESAVEPLPMLRDYGETYAPPADVLNDTFYNGQYGWLLGGFIAPPPGATALWVEVVDQTAGLRTYDRFTFEPILGTAAGPALWPWDGTMAHNWYAADGYGEYQATYSVYFGDATGAPTPGYGAGGVTLTWRACPCDLDENGVDVFDLLAYLNLWFMDDPAADWTDDEPAVVDVFDLLAYLSCWFEAC